MVSNESDFNIENCEWTRNRGLGVICEHKSRPYITGGQFSKNLVGFSATGSSCPKLVNSVLIEHQKAAIHAGWSSVLEVEKTRIYGKDVGIEVTHQVQPKCTDLHIFKNKKHGGEISDRFHPQFYRCIFFQNGGAGLVVSTNARALWRECRLEKKRRRRPHSEKPPKVSVCDGFHPQPLGMGRRGQGKAQIHLEGVDFQNNQKGNVHRSPQSRVTGIDSSK